MRHRWSFRFQVRNHLHRDFWTFQDQTPLTSSISHSCNKCNYACILCVSGTVLGAEMRKTDISCSHSNCTLAGETAVIQLTTLISVNSWCLLMVSWAQKTQDQRLADLPTIKMGNNLRTATTEEITKKQCFKLQEKFWESIHFHNWVMKTVNMGTHMPK